MSGSLEKNQNQLLTDITTDIITILADLATLKSDTTILKSNDITMLADLLSIETKINTIISDLVTVKADLVTIKADLIIIKADLVTIKGNLVTVLANQTDIEAKIDVVDGYHDIPAQNSVANSVLRDIIGNKLDNENGNSIYAKLYLILEHFHTSTFCRPTLSNGITLTKQAGAWAAYPTPTEIIAANSIAFPFDLHFMNVSNISANGEYQVQIYAGLAGFEIAVGDGHPISRSAVQSQEGTRQIRSPLFPANTRISLALTGNPAGAETAIIKIEGHTY